MLKYFWIMIKAGANALAREIKWSRNGLRGWGGGGGGRGTSVFLWKTCLVVSINLHSFLN